MLKMCPAASLDAEQSDSDSESDLALPAMAEVTHTDLTTLCKLCFRPAQAPDVGLKLGPLYSYGHCQAHLYCLMFSSGLEQGGEEEEGIKGFLVEDIVREWRRGSRLKCCHCKQTYATLGCVGKGCKKSYHLPCGIENGSLQQFFGAFSSLCETHRPVQSPCMVKREANNGGECGVCLEELEERPGSGVLWTPCCGGWFHRNCVERMAETAGCHFFKCPLCNNRQQFSEEMQQFGIYVPDQDAEWEAGSAYDDQLERHGSCDAASCLCLDGNQYDEDDTIWEIILCSCCGAQGIHVECGQLRLGKPRWKCSFCKKVVAGLPNKPVSVFTRVKSSGHSVNQFARNILENLSFKANTNELSIGVFKNRHNIKEPAVATFVVNPVPAGDVPLPVKVYEDDLKHKTKDKMAISNTPLIEISGDKIDAFGVPFKVLKDDFQHIPKNNIQDSEAALVEISGDKVNIVDVPLKVLKDDQNLRTRRTIQESEVALVVNKTADSKRNEHKSTNSWLSFEASPDTKILSRTDQLSKKAVSSTPLTGSSSKKRKLTPPVGQPSILNFFQSSLSPKEKASPTNFQSKHQVQSSADREVSGNVKDELKLSTAQDVNNKMYSCEACDLKTQFKSNFMRHLRKQHGHSIEIKSNSPHMFSLTGSNTPASEVDCVICKDPVIPGDDYKCHLNFAHDIVDLDEVEKHINVSWKEADTLISSDIVNEVCDSDEITIEDSLLSIGCDVSGEEVLCGICKDPVMMGDDYKCHLQFGHEITDRGDLEKYVGNAQTNIKY